MTSAFEQAFDMLKTPLWYRGMEDEPIIPDEPKVDDERFPDYLSDLMERLIDPDVFPDDYETGRAWESKEGDARGHARVTWDDDERAEHHISHFEMAQDARGQGLSRDRLKAFIEELRGADSHLSEGDISDTHVVNVEPDTIDYWNKLVSEGLLTGASNRRTPNYTPDGTPQPYIKPLHSDGYKEFPEYQEAMRDIERHRP